jgi:hypothetical protein
LLVNEKTGEYDFELGLLMLVSGCNVTPKNVKTNKILPSRTATNDVKTFTGGRFLYLIATARRLIHLYILCFRRNVLKIGFL